MTTTTRLIPTELYEDNAGSLYLIESDQVHDVSASQSSYAEDATDQGWFSDTENLVTDDAGEPVSAEEWLDSWLYNEQGYLKNDGALKHIASTDEAGNVTVIGSTGSAGRNYLQLKDEDDEA